MDKLNKQNQSWLDESVSEVFSNGKWIQVLTPKLAEAKLLEMQTEIERLKRGLNAIANWEKCSPEDTNEVVALLKELAKGVTPK